MRILILLSFSLLVIHGVIFSQSCLPEGITFQTQSQIDNFHNDYPGCTIIEGNVSFAPNVVTSLVGLDGITAVNGDLNISITWLEYLTGLNSLTKVGGNLIFNHNDRFRSLSALENLDSIGGVFELSYSDTLPNLNGLENLTYVGDSLQIVHCDSLTDLTGLNNLTHVGNLMFIYWNDNLVSLEGLNGLESVVSIYIHDNDALTDVSALGNLDTIPLYLSFGHNGALSNFYGLNSIKSINGGLRVTNNNALINFVGFDSLTYAGFLLIGSTDAGGNTSLLNLSGLDNIQHIGGDLIISRNPMLNSITALSGLDSIAGYIEIYHNDALSSLDGLDNISSKSITDLTITENSALSECSVESICDYLLAPNGEVDIHGNNTGCNSQQEVEDACGVGLDESAVSSRQSAVNIYPNPASSLITIETPGMSSKFQFSIFNLNGQQLISRQITENQTEVDISGLPLGVYCVRLSNDRTVILGKFVRQKN